MRIVALVVVDVDLGLHVGPVLLGEGGHECRPARSPYSSVRSSCFEFVSSRNRRQNLCRSRHRTSASTFSSETPAAPPSTAASGTRRSSPRSLRTIATSCPALLRHRRSRLRPSAGPPGLRHVGRDDDSARRTVASPPRSAAVARPRRRHLQHVLVPTEVAPRPARASSARDAGAQSSTVTFCPSRRSMRTSSSGRPLRPAALAARRDRSRARQVLTRQASSSVPFTSCRGPFKEQKNVGSIPHIQSLAARVERRVYNVERWPRRRQVDADADALAH